MGKSVCHKKTPLLLNSEVCFLVFAGILQFYNVSCLRAFLAISNFKLYAVTFR